MRSKALLLQVLALLSLAPAIGAQIVPVTPTLRKAYSVPVGLDAGGLDWWGFPAPSDTPRDWRYVDGLYYVMDDLRLVTNVFDSQFRFVRSITSNPLVRFETNGHVTPFVKFDDLDVAYARYGVLSRVSLDSKPVATYDLAGDFMRESGLAKRSDVPENAYWYHLGVNNNEALVYGKDGSLEFVLFRDGQVVREAERLQEYARRALLSHSWVGRNQQLAQDMSNIVLRSGGFVGETSVSDNVAMALTGLLVEHFRAKGTLVPLSDINDYPRVTDRGFWAYARSVGKERRAYYFDLVTDSVFLLTGLFPDIATYWSEERKLAFWVNKPDGISTLKILEYSLDFLKGP